MAYRICQRGCTTLGANPWEVPATTVTTNVPNVPPPTLPQLRIDPFSLPNPAVQNIVSAPIVLPPAPVAALRNSGGSWLEEEAFAGISKGVVVAGGIGTVALLSLLAKKR